MEHKSPSRRKRAIRVSFVAGVGIVIALLIVERPRLGWEESLTGAVLVSSPDPRKQLPVPNVEITAEAGGTTAQGKSDASGFFRIQWRAGIWPGEQVTLSFRHPDYEPFEITRSLSDQLYIARMKSLASVKREDSQGSEILVGHLRIRYAVKATNVVNIGSTAKTFEIANTGNVPCAPRHACSPDGKWNATVGTIALDAGEGQEFQNVRVSCIAGPCAFTKFDSDNFSHGGRKIGAAVRVWSDTVTFLVEAEVVQSMLIDSIRLAYPSIFGNGMTFTLPATGQGPSIEAEVNGVAIVFPLGPDLSLSWATCSVQIAANRTKLYTCALRPGYRFP